MKKFISSLIVSTLIIGCATEMPKTSHVKSPSLIQDLQNSGNMYLVRLYTNNTGQKSSFDDENKILENNDQIDNTIYKEMFTRILNCKNDSLVCQTTISSQNAYVANISKTNNTVDLKSDMFNLGFIFSRSESSTSKFNVTSMLLRNVDTLKNKVGYYQSPNVINATSQISMLNNFGSLLILPTTANKTENEFNTNQTYLVTITELQPLNIWVKYNSDRMEAITSQADSNNIYIKLSDEYLSHEPTLFEYNPKSKIKTVINYRLTTINDVKYIILKRQNNDNIYLEVTN